MNKAILVIDMPKHCGECPICEVWEAIPSCEEYYCNAAKNDNVDQYKRPDWCPLKPVPKEQLVWYDDEWSAWERGYNSCLHEIIGDEEDYE